MWLKRLNKFIWNHIISMYTVNIWLLVQYLNDLKLSGYQMVQNSSLVWLDPILNMLLLVHTSILTDQQESLHYPSPPYTFRLLKLLSCLSFAVQKPDTFDTVNRKRLNFFYTLYTSMWLNWLKDRLKMLCEESFAQREQVKLLSRPKKCYFHSRMCDFWQTMMSEKESSIST